MKKITDFFIRLRGLSFLIIAFFFFLIQAYQASYAFQYARGVGPDTFRVFDIFLGLAIVAIPFACFALIIGGWCIFESLRRVHRRTGIIALIGTILFISLLVSFFIVPQFNQSNQPDQLGRSTTDIYIIGLLLIAVTWLGLSLVGLAVLISNYFPPWMRIGGLIILVSLPLDTLIWKFAIGIYSSLYGTAPIFLFMNMVGVALIGFGFLSPKFKV